MSTLTESLALHFSSMDGGANPIKADFNKVTPLHTAVARNREVIKMLLEYGAPKDIDGVGLTLCDCGSKAGRSDVHKLQQEMKLKEISAFCHLLRLHHAWPSGHEQCHIFLICMGAVRAWLTRP